MGQKLMTFSARHQYHMMSIGTQFRSRFRGGKPFGCHSSVRASVDKGFVNEGLHNPICQLRVNLYGAI